MKSNFYSFDQFRQRISITELAIANGYVLNRGKGLKWPVLEHANGDRIIIVNPGSPGNQGYFNPKDDRDRGTLIQFVQYRLGVLFQRDYELSQMDNINQILYGWLNIPYKDKLAMHRCSLPSAYGPKVTEIQFSATLLRPLRDQRFLRSRGIDPATLDADCFKGSILECTFGESVQVAFPYRQHINGIIVGAEVRNTHVKRHMAGTKRSSSVWVSNIPAQTSRVVICESAIDCLSYYQLKGKPGDVYVSFGGTITPGQMVCVNDMVKEMTKDRAFKMIIAVDNDEAGMGYAAKFSEAFPAAERDRPVGKDFNDDLMNQPSMTASVKKQLSM